jgi:hypothetical protein
VLLGIVGVILISHFGATSFGRKPYDPGLMASWMHAIGSIGAILGAYWMTERQNKIQLANAAEQQRIETERRYALVAALLEQAIRQTESVRSDFDVGPSPNEFVFSYSQSDFSASIQRLQALNLVDIGSVELVKGVVAVIDAMGAIPKAINRARTSNNRANYLEGARNCDMAAKAYANAVRAVGITPIVDPFDPDESDPDDAEFDERQYAE